MIRRKVFSARAGKLFSIILTLVVFALAVSGCGGGGGKGGGGGGGSTSGDFSAFIGVWESVDVDPAVTIRISGPIEGSHEKTGNVEHMSFTGAIDCAIFSEGSIAITENDNYMLDDKGILGSIGLIYNMAWSTLNAKAREEVYDQLLGPLANEIDLSGKLEDNKTLIVDALFICHKNDDLINFDASDEDSPDYGEYFTFKKQ